MLKNKMYNTIWKTHKYVRRKNSASVAVSDVYFAIKFAFVANYYKVIDAVKILCVEVCLKKK